MQSIAHENIGFKRLTFVMKVKLEEENETITNESKTHITIDILRGDYRQNCTIYIKTDRYNITCWDAKLRIKNPYMTCYLTVIVIFTIYVTNRKPIYDFIFDGNSNFA